MPRNLLQGRNGYSFDTCSKCVGHFPSFDVATHLLLHHLDLINKGAALEELIDRAKRKLHKLKRLRPEYELEVPLRILSGT